MHVDDTVLYTQGKDFDMIEKALCRDVSSLAAWFHEHEDMLGLELQRG